MDKENNFLMIKDSGEQCISFSEEDRRYIVKEDKKGGDEVYSISPLEDPHKELKKRIIETIAKSNFGRQINKNSILIKRLWAYGFQVKIDGILVQKVFLNNLS